MGSPDGANKNTCISAVTVRTIGWDAMGTHRKDTPFSQRGWRKLSGRGGGMPGGFLTDEYALTRRRKLRIFPVEDSMDAGPRGAGRSRGVQGGRGKHPAVSQVCSPVLAP